MRNTFFGLLICSLALGCSGAPDDLPDLAPVTGKVTADGAAMANVVLEFRPSSGRPSTATTESDGTFTLVYTQEQDGAVVGDHTVVFFTPGAGAQAPEGASEAERAEAAKRAGPPTELAHTESVTVAAGDGNNFDFDLTGKLDAAKQGKKRNINAGR